MGRLTQKDGAGYWSLKNIPWGDAEGRQDDYQGDG